MARGCFSPYTPRPMNPDHPPRRIHAGIFLIAAATLLLQVTLTRVFSVSIWYHFAFLVVSVALFGFGVSGVALALMRPSTRDRSLLAWAPAGFAVTTLLAYVGTNAIPFAPFEIASDPVQVAYFLLVDLLLLIPFFLGGSTVALILRTWPARAGALYAADLVGAALGTLLLFAALPVVGARGAIALAALLGMGAAFALSPTSRGRIASAIGAVAILPFVVVPSLLPEVRIDASKPLIIETEERGGTIAFTGWNALSRIDVVERDGIDPMILIDSAAMTSIARPPDASSPYLRNVSTLVHRMKHAHDVVIIGSGGGMDVHNALAFGARSVTAVEINPLIIDLVTDRYRDEVGGIFGDPRVTLVEDEGRSYVSRAEAPADVVQLTLIDTWAAGASGAYSLTENYLYTTDAFRTYLENLTPDGMLSITRWYFESPRLATLARVALEELGVADAGRHVLVVQHRISTGFLVKRTPFTPEEVAAAHRFMRELGGEVLYDPLRPGMDSFYEIYFAQDDPGPMLAASPTNLTPVSDDRPFFFQMARWSGISLDDLSQVTNQNFLEPLVVPVGQIVLLTALGIGVLLSVILLLVPPITGRLPRHGRWGWLGYFGALGLAFIVVEIVLMQRFALFLGHPTYSVTLVLFAILLFSGLGAHVSGRRGGSTRGALGPVAIGLPIALVLITVAAPPITGALIGLPLAARILIAMLFVAPVAFLMGMPFPVGIRAAAGEDPANVAWAWAANGCTSVIGSVGAVLGAMTIGFSATLLAAAAIYLVALGLLARAGRPLPDPSTG